jgi:hypothetical protein
MKRNALNAFLGSVDELGDAFANTENLSKRMRRVKLAKADERTQTNRCRPASQRGKSDRSMKKRSAKIDVIDKADSNFFRKAGRLPFERRRDQMRSTAILGDTLFTLESFTHAECLGQDIGSLRRRQRGWEEKMTHSPASTIILPIGSPMLLSPLNRD